MVKKCKWCGKEFETNMSKKLYCSIECRKERNRYYGDWLTFDYNGRDWDHREEQFNGWLKKKHIQNYQDT